MAQRPHYELRRIRDHIQQACRASTKCDCGKIYGIPGGNVASPNGKHNRLKPVRHQKTKPRLNQPHLPPRYHTGESINDLSLYERDFSVTIRAKKEQGHPPSVKFKDGIYTSDELRLRGDLENRKAFLRVNVNDIRYGTLFDLKGTYVADVVVDERWLRMEHSLATRQAILKLVNQKYIASKDQDPVGSYVEYLEEAGKSDKKARTKAEEFKRSNQGKEDDLEDDDFPDSPKPPSDDDDDEDPGSISFDDHDLSS